MTDGRTAAAGGGRAGTGLTQSARPGLGPGTERRACPPRRDERSYAVHPTGPGNV